MTSLDTENDLLYLKPHITTNVDFSSILAEVIDHRFHQPSELYKQDLQLITDLRNDSFITHVEEVVDLEIITKLKKYYALLDTLISKFPDDIIDFQWSGLVFKSLKLEKIYILYQLASYYSILAIKESKAEEDGLKKAGIYFQYSAGCLNIVQQLYSLAYNQLFPFNLSQIETLKTAMLAQSQEIYLRKAMIDQLKDSVLLKLAIRISDFYDEALQILGKKEENKNLPLSYFQLKKVYYLCVSFNFYSAHCKKKRKYGEEISYLDQSFELLSQLSQIEDAQCSKLLQDIENLRMQIINKLGTLKHENEMLHLQKVPSFDTLKPLPRAELVKCLVPKDLELETNSNELFIGLVSLEIVEQVYEYQNRFEDFLNCEILAPVTKLNQQIDELLISSNFEDEIAQVASNADLPLSVIQSREKILQLGNLGEIASLMSALQALKLKCRFKLDTVWKLLKDQTIEEEALAKYYGYDRWTLGVIEDDKVGAILINSFKIYENYMKQSEDGDKLICTQVEELRPFLEVYEDEKQLRSYIPDADILVLNPSLQSIMADLRELSLMLNNLENERNSFLKSVKKKVASERILEQYIHVSNEKLKGIKTSPTERADVLGELLKEKIMNFNNEVEYTGRTRVIQEELVSKFSNKTLEFINMKDRLRVSNCRKEALQVLDSTYEGFFEVIGNLNQGKEFYQNLLDNIEVKINQLDGFLSKRNYSIKTLQERLKLNY